MTSSKKEQEQCLIDTNVPVTANCTQDPSAIPDDLDCVENCIEAIEGVMKTGGLVLDSSDEIYNEYLRQLCLSGQKGVGNAFMKWVHDHGWDPSKVERIDISKKGESYDAFPEHEELADFDISDRKFIAVANAHQDKPPILQATDSKWWGWQHALTEVGICVGFLCEN